MENVDVASETALNDEELDKLEDLLMRFAQMRMEQQGLVDGNIQEFAKVAQAVWDVTESIRIQRSPEYRKLREEKEKTYSIYTKNGLEVTFRAENMSMYRDHIRETRTMTYRWLAEYCHSHGIGVTVKRLDRNLKALWTYWRLKHELKKYGCIGSDG